MRIILEGHITSVLMAFAALVIATRGFTVNMCVCVCVCVPLASR